MDNKQQESMSFTEPNRDGVEIPAWKELDEVCRKWATLSNFEKDQSNYAKMKEQYQ